MLTICLEINQTHHDWEMPFNDYRMYFALTFIVNLIALKFKIVIEGSLMQGGE